MYSSSRLSVFRTWRNHFKMSSLTPQNPIFVGKDYAASRPSYPDQLFDTLYSYHSSHQGQWGTAVDIACGTGQATVALARKFKEVYGLDSNPSQLEAASQLPNISYRISTAETLEFEPASIDMITVAQAAHWLDLKEFYAGCSRLLKKGSGTLAIWCYAECHVDDVKVQQGLEAFYDGIKNYWDPRRVLVDNLYKTIEFPLNNVQRHEMSMSRRMKLKDFTKYLETLSSYSEYIKDHKYASGSDPLISYFSKIQTTGNEETEGVIVTWPIALLLGSF